MECIIFERRGGVATDELPRTAARLFAHALLNGPLPSDLRASAELQAERDQLHWLARISSRHEVAASRQLSEQGDADRAHAELKWLAGISSRHERQLWSLQSREAGANEAQAGLQSLLERLRIEEAEWDSAKHPRRGAPPNPGWFAAKGSGGVAGTSGNGPSLRDRIRQRNSEIAELAGVITPGMISCQVRLPAPRPRDWARVARRLRTVS